MKPLFLPAGRAVRLGHRLGSGQQGVVYAVAGDSSLCVKVFFKRGPDLTRRLMSLVKAAPRTWWGERTGHRHLAWPRAIVRDHRGELGGLLMPRVAGVPLARLFDPDRRAAELDRPSWATNLTIAARLAHLFALLHDAGFVVGDVSPNNILVGRAALVSMIDCDSVQFTDARTGDVFEAVKLTPEYAPPEALAANPAPVTRDNDLFGLAVLLCQVLMEGEHPYDGLLLNAPRAVGVADNIRAGANWISAADRLAPVPGAMPVEVLPPGVLRLARRCFGIGHLEPALRPRADEWVGALRAAEHQVTTCPRNGRHTYPASLWDCLWCQRSGLGFEHYPPIPPAGPQQSATRPTGNPGSAPPTRPSPARSGRPRRSGGLPPGTSAVLVGLSLAAVARLALGSSIRSGQS